MKELTIPHPLLPLSVLDFQLFLFLSIWPPLCVYTFLLCVGLPGLSFPVSTDDCRDNRGGRLWGDDEERR